VNSATRGVEVTWWRERDREGDFVVSSGSRVLAIEVASGRRKTSLPGLGAFASAYPGALTLLVGAQGLSIEAALTSTAGELLGESAPLGGEYEAAGEEWAAQDDGTLWESTSGDELDS
jgi:hypothetical protein